MLNKFLLKMAQIKVAGPPLVPLIGLNKYDDYPDEQDPPGLGKDIYGSTYRNGSNKPFTRGSNSLPTIDPAEEKGLGNPPKPVPPPEVSTPITDKPFTPAPAKNTVNKTPQPAPAPTLPTVPPATQQKVTPQPLSSQQTHTAIPYDNSWSIGNKGPMPNIAPGWSRYGAAASNRFSNPIRPQVNVMPRPQGNVMSAPAHAVTGKHR